MTTQQENTTNKQPLIWIDLEMSGLNPAEDVILEVAMIITDSELNPIAHSDEWAVKQPDSVLNNMDKWNTQTHGQSGLIDRCRKARGGAAEVEQLAVKFLKKHVKKKSSPMCGNSICQDRRFLALHMPELEDFFHYRNFDVSAFKIAAQLWYPEFAKQVRGDKMASHQAMDDIRASIKEMRTYRRRMLISPPIAETDAAAASDE